MSTKGVLSVKNLFTSSSGARLKVTLKLPVPVDYIILPAMSIDFPFYSESTSLVLSIDHNYAPVEKYHLTAKGYSHCFPNERMGTPVSYRGKGTVESKPYYIGGTWEIPAVDKEWQLIIKIPGSTVKNANIPDPATDDVTVGPGTP
jgi:hypothetical protein